MGSRIFAVIRYAYARASLEPHRIAQVLPEPPISSVPRLVGVHGYCGACGQPVVMDKLGAFRHVTYERRD